MKVCETLYLNAILMFSCLLIVIIFFIMQMRRAQAMNLWPEQNPIKPWVTPLVLEE